MKVGGKEIWDTGNNFGGGGGGEYDMGRKRELQ